MELSNLAGHVSEVLIRAVILRRERALVSEPRRMRRGSGLSSFEARRAEERAERLRMTVENPEFGNRPYPRISARAVRA